MKFEKDLEKIGWAFWILFFLILLLPGAYIAWNFTYDTASTLIRVGMTVVFAAITSGFISWGINDILFRRKRKQYLQQRKQDRKKKKKKKK